MEIKCSSLNTFLLKQYCGAKIVYFCRFQISLLNCFFVYMSISIYNHNITPWSRKNWNSELLYAGEYISQLSTFAVTNIRDPHVRWHMLECMKYPSLGPDFVTPQTHRGATYLQYLCPSDYHVSAFVEGIQPRKISAIAIGVTLATTCRFTYENSIVDNIIHLFG